MTSEEYDTFSHRLFVQFPSLTEWLERNSPAPQETHDLWEETLRPFRLDECLGVLAAWQQSSSAPFAAHERDQVAAIVASCVRKQREKHAKKHEQDSMRLAVEFNRRGGAYDVLRGDVGMLEAFNKLQPLHKQMLDGEMSREDYEAIEHETLGKL